MYAYIDNRVFPSSSRVPSCPFVVNPALQIRRLPLIFLSLEPSLQAGELQGNSPTWCTFLCVWLLFNSARLQPSFLLPGITSPSDA